MRIQKMANNVSYISYEPPPLLVHLDWKNILPVVDELTILQIKLCKCRVWPFLISIPVRKIRDIDVWIFLLVFLLAAQNNHKAQCWAQQSPTRKLDRRKEKVSMLYICSNTIGKLQIADEVVVLNNICIAPISNGFYGQYKMNYIDQKVKPLYI